MPLVKVLNKRSEFLAQGITSGVIFLLDYRFKIFSKGDPGGKDLYTIDIPEYKKIMIFCHAYCEQFSNRTPIVFLDSPTHKKGDLFTLINDFHFETLNFNWGIITWVS